MPKLLQISQLGHPVLRKTASEVANVFGRELQNLIEDMIATVKEVDGVGIAAPQVYESKRLFIIASKPSKRYPNAPTMKPLAIINPVVLEYSGEEVKGWEGCLSIPGIRALVPRHTSVKVEFTTRDGKRTTRIFKDFVAKIFQHEYDHINGKVFLDRLATTKDVITEREYLKMVAKESKIK